MAVRKRGSKYQADFMLAGVRYRETFRKKARKMAVQDNTAENAPKDQPILVWVRDKTSWSNKPEGWKMGRCVHYKGCDPRLLADGFNGDWDIPYWHPLPDDVE